MSQHAVSNGRNRQEPGLNKKPIFNGRQALRMPSSASQSDESVESEISRLTWLVLDRTASPAEEKRLSELVNSQHSRRQNSPK